MYEMFRGDDATPRSSTARAHRRRAAALSPTLVIAFALACGPDGAVAPHASADGLTSTSGSYRVTLATAPADCSVDVTARLQSFIDAVPDHSTITFPTNACYRIDGGLVLTDRHGLTFEGAGATFRVVTKGTRDRANWTIRSGSDITFRRMIARGANPYAGLSTLAYDSSLEGQHAFRFQGTQTATLDAVQAYDVWGDFVEAEPDWRVAFPGQPVRNLVVRNSRFERNGRMGIGLTHVDGFVLEGSYIGDVRWSAIDLELDDSREVGRNIRIENNRFGRIQHSMFVSKGAGNGLSVAGITIRGNEMTEHLPTCIAAIAVRSRYLDQYWSGWTIADNVLRVRNRAFAIELTRARDVQIAGNRIVSGAAGGCAQEAGMTFANVRSGTVSGNELTGGYGKAYIADALTSGLTYSSNIVR